MAVFENLPRINLESESKYENPMSSCGNVHTSCDCDLVKMFQRQTGGGCEKVWNAVLCSP